MAERHGGRGWGRGMEGGPMVGGGGGREEKVEEGGESEAITSHVGVTAH